MVAPAVCESHVRRSLVRIPGGPHNVPAGALVMDLSRVSSLAALVPVNQHLDSTLSRRQQVPSKPGLENGSSTPSPPPNPRGTTVPKTPRTTSAPNVPASPQRVQNVPVPRGLNNRPLPQGTSGGFITLGHNQETAPRASIEGSPRYVPATTGATLQGLPVRTGAYAAAPGAVPQGVMQNISDHNGTVTSGVPVGQRPTHKITRREIQAMLAANGRNARVGQATTTHGPGTRVTPGAAIQDPSTRTTTRKRQHQGDATQRPDLGQLTKTPRLASSSCPTGQQCSHDTLLQNENHQLRLTVHNMQQQLEMFRSLLRDKARLMSVARTLAVQ